ncbi:MAG: inositol monophosphatase [Desulfobacteraceae bacterium]|jgi:fructose-1,6-bisphosphatase/inositol monophosphatase family enzyme
MTMHDVIEQVGKNDAPVRQQTQEPDLDLNCLRKLAELAAQRAGEIQRLHLGNQSCAILENRSRDLKIEVDRMSEAAICDLIRTTYPNHTIISEESGQAAGDSRYVWIIDPLDGTLNYYFGLPLFCVCVACYRLPHHIRHVSPGAGFRHLAQAEQLVGVVHAPLLSRMYSAAAGSGATVNGSAIPPPIDSRVEDAMVGISFGSDDTIIEKMERLNARLVRRVKKVRIFGSTGLDLAHVATGHLSALIQLNVQIWDIAAALVILKESGVVYDVRPTPLGGWQFIAAAPSVFQPLKAIFDAAQV